MRNLASLDISMPVARAARLAFFLANFALIVIMLALSLGFAWNNPHGLIAGEDVFLLACILAVGACLAAAAFSTALYALGVIWFKGYRGFGRVFFALALLGALGAYPAYLWQRWMDSSHDALNVTTANFNAQRARPMMMAIGYSSARAKMLEGVAERLETYLFQPVYRDLERSKGIATGQEQAFEAKPWFEAKQSPSAREEPILIALPLEDAYRVVMQSLLAKGYWPLTSRPPSAKDTGEKSETVEANAGAAARAGKQVGRKGAGGALVHGKQNALPVEPTQADVEIAASVLSPLLLFRDVVLISFTARGQATEVNLAYIPRFALSDFNETHGRIAALAAKITEIMEEQ